MAKKRNLKILKILGTGKAKRELMFVDDFADNRRMQIRNFDAKASVDGRNKELLTPLDVYSLELEPA